VAATPLVSIVVLNYNGVHFLKTCFDTVLAGTYPAVELIMADNASTDDSVGFVQENYPQVTIIETGGNNGYSAAYNLALGQVKGAYAVLLNNDVEVTPSWLEPLVAEMETHPDVAACQPKIRHMLNREAFEYAGAAGGFMDPYGFPFLRGRILSTIEDDTGQYDDPVDVFWASGAALMVRLDAYQSVGGLDEDFVHHMEEIDLCWRLLLSGKRLRAVPSSTIYHYAGGTIKPDSYKKMYLNHRNSVFMLIKNYSLPRLAWILPVRLILDGTLIIVTLISLDLKRLVAVPAAYLWLLAHLPRIMRARKESQSHRQVSDAQLDRLFYPGSLVIAYYLRGKKTFSQLWPSAR
jgi:hypothetical protein